MRAADGRGRRETNPPPRLTGSYLVLELANACNLKCTHCAQSDEDHPHYAIKGTFPLDGVRALLDDLKAMGAHFDTLILFWLGEPLLHPKFAEVYQTILDAIDADGRGGLTPFSKVEVHTNAILLNAKLSRAILNSAAVPQRWHFTLDAHDPKTYKDIKGAAQLNKVQKNVEHFYRLKAEGQHLWPQTALQYIVSDRNEHETGAYIDHWLKYLKDVGLQGELTAHHVPDLWRQDFVFLKSLDCPTPKEQIQQNAVFRRVVARHAPHLSRQEQTAAESVVAENLNPCSGFWKSPVIRFDGQLTVCTRDSLGENALGNVLETPFSQLWYANPRLDGWREGVGCGNYDALPLCQTCFIPQSVNYTDILPEEIDAAQRWRAGEKTPSTQGPDRASIPQNNPAPVGHR